MKCNIQHTQTDTTHTAVSFSQNCSWLKSILDKYLTTQKYVKADLKESESE